MFSNEYQGGTHVEVLGTQGQNPLSAWKVSGPQKGVQKVYDKVGAAGGGAGGRGPSGVRARTAARDRSWGGDWGLRGCSGGFEALGNDGASRAPSFMLWCGARCLTGAEGLCVCMRRGLQDGAAARRPVLAGAVAAAPAAAAGDRAGECGGGARAAAHRTCW